MSGENHSQAMRYLISLLALAVLIGTGCSTTDKPIVSQPTAESLAPILSGSVAGAVVYAYSRNPAAESYAAAIRAALYEFSLSTNLSPVALQTTLYRLPIKELQTAEAQLIIAPLLATYKGFADEKVKAGLFDDPGLRRLVQALVDGLDQGLLGIVDMKAHRTAPQTSLPAGHTLDVIVQALQRQVNGWNRSDQSG